MKRYPPRHKRLHVPRMRLTNRLTSRYPINAGFGSGLCLLVAIAFSCHLGAILAPCLRTQCRSFYERLYLPLGQLALTLDPSGLMKSAACQRLSRSTVTGRFPLSLSQPLGPPVRCFLHFIFATSNTNMMAYFLWVLSWLRVLG